MNFIDKVAIVTGGSQGIARAYVSALLNIGMKVCICDVKEETAKEFLASLPPAEGNKVIFQKCDVTSAEELRSLNPKYVWAPIYCATKSAVVGLKRSYGSEYHFKKTGVAVNAICPAFTDTELLRIGTRREVDDPGSVSSEGERTLKPEEVAEALIQLLEDGENGALLLVETGGVKYV